MPSTALLLALLTPSMAAAASFCDTTAGWNQTWVDEFTGDDIDSSSWSVSSGACGSYGRSANCTLEDTYIEDGSLVLRSRQPSPGVYTTGAVTTAGKVAWKDSPKFRMCISAILPSGRSAGGSSQGIWPAHWLMPDDSSCDPDEGEVDILEMINGDSTAYATYHWIDNWPAETCKGTEGNNHYHHINGAVTMPDDWDSAYHEYAVERSSEYLAFVVDGKTVLNKTVDSSDVTAPLLWQMPFHLILNTAIGGGWPGEPDDTTGFPAYHKIDFVKVSTSSQDGENPLADPDQCGNFCDPQFGPGCGPGACANCREAGLDAQGAIAYACQN
ncbi:hypothetical protein TeGR_g12354 [Tetraparma gracilis]|uniref:GH16 domain-containing protein n=1 Tax=Tetraparma gracilis TaxID=2962635 RepID=A0ABQ6MXI9_9STRA|nr:hypothetical protein TeGR_g12354 [Tetraparma gracilis]